MDDKPAPNIALQYLRKAAKAYLAYFPGSGIIIDLTFNRLDAIVDQHAEQATEYVKHAYSQFQRVVQHGKNKHESHTALEVLALCKRLAEDLGTLGGVNIPIGNIIERAAAPIGAVVGGIFADLQGKFKKSIDQLTGKAPSQVLCQISYSESPSSNHALNFGQGCNTRQDSYTTELREGCAVSKQGGVKRIIAENHSFVYNLTFTQMQTIGTCPCI